VTKRRKYSWGPQVGQLCLRWTSLRVAVKARDVSEANNIQLWQLLCTWLVTMSNLYILFTDNRQYSCRRKIPVAPDLAQYFLTHCTAINVSKSHFDPHIIHAIYKLLRDKPYLKKADTNTILVSRESNRLTLTSIWTLSTAI